MFIFVTPLSEHTFKNDTKASLGNFASPEQISMMQQVSAPAPTAVVKSNCEICPIEESVKQENSTTPTESLSDNQSNIVATIKYHIIVASSPSEANADLAIKELISKAKFDYTKVKGNGRFRISAGGYATHEEAQSVLSDIQATFPDAWILKHQ
jgi:hypothetical protein